MPLQFQIEVFAPASPVHPSSHATSPYSNQALQQRVPSAEPSGSRRAEVIQKSSEQQVLPLHQVNCLKRSLETAIEKKN